MLFGDAGGGVVLGLYENAKLALLPVLSPHEQIRQENGETAVVVQPPDIDEAMLILAVKEVDALESALVYLSVLESKQLVAFEERGASSLRQQGSILAAAAASFL